MMSVYSEVQTSDFYSNLSKVGCRGGMDKSAGSVSAHKRFYGSFQGLAKLAASLANTSSLLCSDKANPYLKFRQESLIRFTNTLVTFTHTTSTPPTLNKNTNSKEERK